MIPYKELVIVVVGLSVLGGAYGIGNYNGRVSEIRKAEKVRVALQEELFDLSENLGVKNAEILRLSKEREDLVDELENEAVNAEGSSGPGVGSTGGLRRLERRWGETSESTN